VAGSKLALVAAAKDVSSLGGFVVSFLASGNVMFSFILVATISFSFFHVAQSLLYVGWGPLQCIQDAGCLHGFSGVEVCPVSPHTGQMMGLVMLQRV